MAIIIFGTPMTGIGYTRFRAANRAIRAGKLPLAGIESELAIGIVIVAAIAPVIAHFTGAF